MKNLFLSLVLVMVGLVANSQKPSYFYPQFEAMYVLDSLNIPYLPIPERNGISEVGRTYSTEKGVKKHNKYFCNNEFDFLPSKNTPSIPFNSFVSSYIFLNENDVFKVNMISYYDWNVIGFSKIRLSDGNYKSVEIIEYHTNFNDTYGTVVLLETQLGKMTFVNSLNHTYEEGWEPTFE